MVDYKKLEDSIANRKKYSEEFEMLNHMFRECHKMLLKQLRDNTHLPNYICRL
jgi:hypothetical protein